MTKSIVIESRRTRNQETLDTFRGLFSEMFNMIQTQIDNDTLDHLDLQKYVPNEETTPEGSEYVRRRARTDYYAVTLHVVSRTVSE